MYEKLRETRLKLNIAVDDLCSLLDLKTVGAYYKKESGATRFSLDEGIKIAQFFKSNVEDIFFKHDLSQMKN